MHSDRTAEHNAHPVSKVRERQWELAFNEPRTTVRGCLQRTPNGTKGPRRTPAQSTGRCHSRLVKTQTSEKQRRALAGPSRSFKLSDPAQFARILISTRRLSFFDPLGFEGPYAEACVRLSGIPLEFM